MHANNGNIVDYTVDNAEDTTILLLSLTQLTPPFPLESKQSLPIDNTLLE